MLTVGSTDLWEVGTEALTDELQTRPRNMSSLPRPLFALTNIEDSSAADLQSLQLTQKTGPRTTDALLLRSSMVVIMGPNRQGIIASMYEVSIL